MTWILLNILARAESPPQYNEILKYMHFY